MEYNKIINKIKDLNVNINNFIPKTEKVFYNENYLYLKINNFLEWNSLKSRYFIDTPIFSEITELFIDFGGNKIHDYFINVLDLSSYQKQKNHFRMLIIFYNIVKEK